MFTILSIEAKKNMKRLVILVSAVLMSLPSLAWEYKDNATIKQLVQFEAGISRDVMLVEFEDSSGSKMWCHVGYDNQPTISMLLALYIAGKKTFVHCYEETQNFGGYNSRKLHRIVTR